MRRLALDDLPRFSPWPARLLGLERWSLRHKTRLEVLREYEQEKWGALLSRLNSAGRPPTLDNVIKLAYDATEEHVCSEGEELVLMSAGESHERYVEVVADAVARHASGATALLELGAGFGATLFTMLKRPSFSKMNAFAAELSTSGVELLRMISRQENLPVTCGFCDLDATPLLDFDVPPQAVVFTSMAVPYVRHVPRLLASIAHLNPHAVVHVEPIYEHYSVSTLLGMMRRRYVEINDYCRGFLTAIKAEENAGAVRIIEEAPVVFGKNPLFPVSILAWAPA